MMHSPVGAHARLTLNGLTVVSSVFAGWGWAAEVTSWPPSLTDVGWIVLAAVAVAAQHLANAAAALAQRALRHGQVLTTCAGAGLVLAFAGVASVGVEHALEMTQRLQRIGAAAPLLAEIAACEAEIAANQTALRALPADVPGSRITILQAPLREAIARSETRLTELRAAYTAASAPPHNAIVARVFMVLAFAEPIFYWLLAASEVQSVPAVPVPAVPVPAVPVPAPRPPARTRAHVPQPDDRQARPRGRRVGVPPSWGRTLKGALAGLALFAPGAVAPPNPPPRGSSVQAQAPLRPTPVEAGTTGEMTTPVPAARPAARATPDWLAAAQSLRHMGLSIRAIGRRLGVPKSTVGRWLQWADAPPPARR